MVTEQHLENAIETFRGSEVKITTEGKKHLGAAIGSEDFKASYVKSLVDNWINQLKLLLKFAEPEYNQLVQPLLEDLKENFCTL